MKKGFWGLFLCGAAAGTVNGLLGAGGGMLLVPLLTLLTDLEDDKIFPASVTVILPVCLVSLAFSWSTGTLCWIKTVPYLIGSGAGGILAGLLGKKIPTLWLHRFLGLVILWGGARYLWHL